MSGYVFPCETNGKCRELQFKEWGFKWPHISPVYGQRRIFGIKFKCCTWCHLPFSKAEADWLNKQLGYTPDDIEIDPSFLDMLNGIE
jgi:hypothetical protein